MAGAPKGNQNAAKGRRWLAAINTALERRSKAEGQQALVELAEKLLAACDNGDSWALRELGDRLDGKAHQSMDVVHTERPAEELDDSELEHIAATGRTRAVKAPRSPQKPTGIH